MFCLSNPRQSKTRKIRNEEIAAQKKTSLAIQKKSDKYFEKSMDYTSTLKYHCLFDPLLLGTQYSSSSDIIPEEINLTFRSQHAEDQLTTEDLL
jgi:hypothetical protein